MRILIDIGHPAHVHYFKNIANHFIKKGCLVKFTAREKEVSLQLLQNLGFDYISLGKPYKTLFGKIWGIFLFSFRLFRVAKNFKPDIYLNATQYSALVAWLFRKPHVSIEDTFNMEQVKLYLPFTDVVLTGDYKHPHLGEKEIRYSGYQELLYLHPNYFKPDPNIVNFLGLLPGEKYSILRFVSWQASHDIGHNGVLLENKRRIVAELSPHSRVFISSESELPPDLEKYRLTIPPEKMHDAIAFASLLYGESATMASEAAMLGTPAIYIDSTSRYYTKDQEIKYGLIFNFTESIADQEKSIKKALELIRNNHSKVDWQKRRDHMLVEKIDVTSFMIWFIENYPQSFKIMKDNPEYQMRFK